MNSSVSHISGPPELHSSVHVALRGVSIPQSLVNIVAVASVIPSPWPLEERFDLPPPCQVAHPNLRNQALLELKDIFCTLRERGQRDTPSPT